MNFKDKGFIIGSRAFCEKFKIVDIFSSQHGLISALVKYISKKSLYIYQVGNLIDFTWQSRIESQLGVVKCELLNSFVAGLFKDKKKLYAFNSLTYLLKLTLKEKEPYPVLFNYIEKYLKNLLNNFSFAEYIKLELNILFHAGYGLDLSKCAVTGNDYDLYYVSPKSGRAISRQVGSRYNDKLLKLPQFLLVKRNFLPNDEDILLTMEEKKDAILLTDYFLKRYLIPFSNKNCARSNFVNILTESL